MCPFCRFWRALVALHEFLARFFVSRRQSETKKGHLHLVVPPPRKKWWKEDKWEKMAEGGQTNFRPHLRIVGEEPSRVPLPLADTTQEEESNVVCLAERRKRG